MCGIRAFRAHSELLGVAEFDDFFFLPRTFLSLKIVVGTPKKWTTFRSDKGNRFLVVYYSAY